MENLDVDRIPDLRIYLKGEKKKPKHLLKDFELQHMTTYIKSHFSNIGIDNSAEFIEEVSLDIMTPEDREVKIN